MPKSINLTGTAGNSYNLDDLQNKNTRTDASEGLIVQIWMWNPDLPGDHGKPNPPSLELGQIWLSKLISREYKDPNTGENIFEKLLAEYSNKAGV